MRINQLAPLAQSTQRTLTEYEVFLPGVGKCKPSLAPPHKQQIKILFSRVTALLIVETGSRRSAAAALNVPASATAASFKRATRKLCTGVRVSVRRRELEVEPVGFQRPHTLSLFLRKWP
jgi:hypothetical protein